MCLLHGNELPLRVLMHHFVGDTKDPRTFKGPIGKKLTKCESLPIVEFITMESGEDIINMDSSVLNTDNKYLVDICRIIATGEVPQHLDIRPPGKYSKNVKP